MRESRTMRLEYYYKEKTILITGAAQGLGFALGHALHKLGATIILSDIISPSQADRILEDGLEFVQLDVTDFENYDKVVKDIVQRHGKLDMLINNAGVCVVGEIADLSMSHWSKTVGVNLMGAIHGCHIATQIMAAQGYGQIVNIASISGLLPIPATAPYVTSKFGIVGLSRTLRIETASLGLKVNLVCPGKIATSMFEKLPIIKIPRKAIEKNNPFKAVPVDQAVEIIIDRVSKNKFLIIFPFTARLLYQFSRCFPGLFDRVAAKKIRTFRENGG